MVQLPVIDRLDLTGYGLYPGVNGSSSLDFSGPLSLVLGANGIGKTTLISMIFRMLTGPYDLPAARRKNLGRGALQEKELTRPERRYFANRVNDGALNATATISFRLGATRFEVSRHLSDLRLVSATTTFDGRDETTTGEDELKGMVTSAAALGDYVDWILLLRYVSFLQEDRQALIWDVDAQTEILRPLFLSPADSNRWVELERTVLQFDSRRRNLSFVIFQSAEWVRRQDRKISSAPELRTQIDLWEAALDASRSENEEVLRSLAEADDLRKSSRLAYLIAEENLQEARATYERSKLRFVLNGLPSPSATAQYIISQLVTSGYCVACGQDSEALEQAFEHRIETNLCVVCGRPYLDSTENPLDAASQELSAQLEQVDEKQTRLDEDEAAYREVVERSRSARQVQADLEERIEDARSQLPEEERETSQRRSELDILRDQLAATDADLVAARAEFSTFLTERTRQILTRASEIEGAFNRYASAFLLEANRLTWSEQRQRVGQMGETLPFPNFALEMRGTDFESATTRASSDSVSESQREFIDLAFRMALIDLASEQGATIVIDAPDSSLDAVFEPKAADVLSSYVGMGTQKRLVLTSNISSGDFLPELVLRTREQTGLEPMVIDLFRVGVPTAALQELPGRI